MAVINPPIQRKVATEIVEFAFGGECDLLGVVPLPGGQVNSTGMLILDDGRRLVLRIAPDPARADEGPSWLSPFGLRRELAVVAAAPDLAPLLPTTVMHDFHGVVVNRDWVLQEVMPGVPLDSLLPSLDDETAATIWAEVGRFMRRLHDYGEQPFGPLVWGAQFDSWPDLLAHDLQGLQADAERYGLPREPFRRLGGAIERQAGMMAGVAPALIHSDLNPGHIFVTDDDEDGTLHLGGVIDLEYGRMADPLSEHLLASALTDTTGSLALRSIVAAYGKRDLNQAETVRIGIASALGAAWDATLVAFQQGDSSPAMDRLDLLLGDLENG